MDILRSFDPHDPEFLKNPYETYARFRESTPVHWVEPYESYWVFRYEDVKQVLDDTEVFKKQIFKKQIFKKDADGAPPPFSVLANMPEGVFSLDPPRHDEVRQILDPLFQEALGGAKEEAASFAGKCLIEARQSGRIELYQQYALPLPRHMLMTLIGIPENHEAGVARWVEGCVAGHDITARPESRGMAGTCTMALGAYFQALLRGGGPVAPRKGKLLDLMKQVTPQGMALEEVQQTAVNFMIAGYVSTIFLIATGTLNLLKHPEQLQLLRENPQWVDRAVEEMLRFDAPAQLVDRVVANDLELGGVQLRVGDKVTAVLGSANHDPQAFKDPDQFNINRDKEAHLGFGHGIHYCIGAPLVRIVVPIAFRTLLQELPNLKLDGNPQWQTDPYLRSVINLPLSIG